MNKKINHIRQSCTATIADRTHLNIAFKTLPKQSSVSDEAISDWLKTNKIKQLDAVHAPVKFNNKRVDKIGKPHRKGKSFRSKMKAEVEQAKAKKRRK